MTFEQECRFRQEWLLQKLSEGFFTLEEIQLMLVTEFEDEVVDPQAILEEVLKGWVADDKIVLIGIRYCAR